ncbi:hypothetical protein SAMN04488005_1938 [Yoonia tamlensis]|uniref:Uncharacterized protein n=1 Tax=Yoonia tamlensis TaxID=390270 RepID=A0A1I6GNP5_9RHOB|nr:hypothetical protein SAMN04488005_1938 [Yoonia tamlensis]
MVDLSSRRTSETARLLQRSDVDLAQPSCAGVQCGHAGRQIRILRGCDGGNAGHWCQHGIGGRTRRIADAAIKRRNLCTAGQSDKKKGHKTHSVMFCIPRAPVQLGIHQQIG